MPVHAVIPATVASTSRQSYEGHRSVDDVTYVPAAGPSHRRTTSYDADTYDASPPKRADSVDQQPRVYLDHGQGDDADDCSCDEDDVEEGTVMLDGMLDDHKRAAQY
jgi:hypothetical protein